MERRNPNTPTKQQKEYTHRTKKEKRIEEKRKAVEEGSYFDTWLNNNATARSGQDGVVVVH